MTRKIGRKGSSPTRLVLAAAVLAAALAWGAGARGSTGGVGLPGGSHHHHRHRHHVYHRKAFVPPHGRKFHGVSDTEAGPRGVVHFQRQVGAHPAVLEDFYHWDTPLTTGALDRWQATRTRGVLSLSTAPGDGTEIIGPKQIATGRDDHYLVRLNASISGSGQVVYLRPFGEMNGSWNPYSAFNSDGSPRPGHSTRQFVRAWRRFAIIVRGGSVGAINRHLLALGMPRLLRARSNRDRIYRRENVGDGLAHPRVAMIWSPQTISSPNVHGNQPGRYWPGGHYVDWVGADIYSKFASPSVRSALSSFHRRYRRYPFAIGEYSPWDNDFRGTFVHWLFRWAKQHRNVRMVIYYRSITAHSAFDIGRYPGARRGLRHILNGPRYMQYAPGTRTHGHRN